MTAVSLYILYGVVKHAKKIKISEIIEEVKYCSSYGARLMPYSIAGWAIGNLDKIIIFKINGQAEDVVNLGIAQSLLLIMSFAFVALNSAWTPKFYQLHKNNEKKPIEKFRKKYIYILLIVFLSLQLISFFIVEFYLRKDYSELMKVIFFLSVARTIDGDSLFYSNYIYYSEKVGLISRIAISSAIVYIILLISLTYLFGLIGLLVASLTNSIIVNISYRMHARNICLEY
jgi:O-antigen/teichoic acid export membrane protein